LDESRSPEFNPFSDLEENSEEEVTETMEKTMEEYMSKTRANYGSGIAKPKIDDKDHFELKGQFLKELCNNTFSGSDHEDMKEHIKKVLEIFDLFHIHNITQDQVILRVFPMIGHLHINNALADLGSSISLMPYTMYEKLDLGEPKPTRMRLELADSERSFLATARAMIDVYNKKITLRVGDYEVIFDVDQSIKRSPAEDDECYGIDELDDTINIEARELLGNDDFDSFLLKGLEKSINQSDLESCDSIGDKSGDDSDLGTPIRRIDLTNTPRKPFGLCNAPATFQRCMTAIFHDIVEDFMEVFMDDFLVFGNSFNCCLANLDRMLASKQDAKPRLIRTQIWEYSQKKRSLIADEFPDEHLMILKAELNADEPWYADYVNYIVGKIVPPKWTSKRRRGFFWPSIFKDAKDYILRCDACQRSGNISSRSEMPQKNIQALKQCNMELEAAAKNRFMELNELMELRDGAYENTRIYKERTKKWHDSRLRGDKDFKVGDKVLLFNSRLRMHLGKLKSKWYGPNVVETVYPYRTVEITDKNRTSLKVNWHRLKKYYDGRINMDDKEVVAFKENMT
ncbi:DNA-directed DNA polymerase, partial [Tanacetum coccineum]